MGRCDGFCRPEMTEEEYRRRIEQAVALLEGKSKQLLRDMTAEMEAEAETLRFEQAAALRDRINAIGALGKKQTVIAGLCADTDIWGLYRGAGKSCYAILHMEDGSLTGRETELFTAPMEETEEEMLSALTAQYYLPRAILPAVLYFTGIYIAVHLEAKKLGLQGIPRDQLPKMGNLMKKIYLLFPLVLLVILVSTNTFTMAKSAAIAIVAAVAVGLLNNVVDMTVKNVDRTDFLTFGKILDALEGGARGSITVAVACGVAGIISGCITVTGLASKLLSTIVSLSGGHMIIALALTMLCCIVLGMGVPTTANYCIMAATCAPILMDPSIGVTKMAAHFFVFYFGIVADITPPVALAAYAGSAIAKADPMKTGVNATKLAIAAFIVPYIFAMNPQMLFVDVSSALQVVQICISALLGIFGVAAALNGFLYRPIPALLRVAMAVGGLGMMIPGTATDIAGFVLVVGIVLYQRFSARRAAMV